MKNISGFHKNLELYVHYLIALCGGIFGMYAVSSRMGNLGQAQTSNLIEIIRSIIGRNMAELSLRVTALLLFEGGMILATIIEKRTTWNAKYLAIGIDLIAAIAIGLFPLDMTPLVALYPVFFATAFQWCVFKGANGYVSATIFSSNNLKQMTVSAVECFLLPKQDSERIEKKRKALFFGGTLLSFHLGVLLGYLLWLHYGVRSIWFNAVPLLLSFILVTIDCRQQKKAGSQP